MKKKIIIGGLLLSIGALFCAQTFVVPKQEKPKKESRSQLKERACQVLYDLLNESTDFLGSLSRMQRTMLGWISNFVAGDKKNNIDAATDAELKALIAQLEEIQKQYKIVQANMERLLSFGSKK
jgi:hypothetical protein